MSNSDSEKGIDTIAPVRTSGSIEVTKADNTNESFEVFKKGEGTVDFRT
ncbi:hypothetical protein VDGD_20668 [Verticillium dahliae]|nr:hypothetical protein VDGD_20668 [Verticillium dahliae]